MIALVYWCLPTPFKTRLNGSRPQGLQKAFKRAKTRFKPFKTGPKAVNSGKKALKLEARIGLVGKSQNIDFLVGSQNGHSKRCQKWP